MIGRAYIEGSKSNVAMNAWLPQASYACGNFFDTSTFEFRRSKGLLGHAFTVRIHTGSQNETRFYPSVPHEISVLVELILGHLRYLLTDVLPQPNSPPDNVFRPDRPAERALGPKRGAVCSHSNPSQKIKVGRRCTPRGDPTNQLRCALRVYSPVDSHTCQTPWSVFEDGSNGEPTGQRPERTDVEARQRRALPATIEETAFHERTESPGFGRPLIHAGPHPESIGEPAHRHSTSFSGRITGPHPLSSRQFQALFDSLLNALFIFPSRVRAQRGSHPLRRPLPGDLGPRVIPPDLGSRSERLSAKGSWSPGRSTGRSCNGKESLVATTTCRDVHRRGLAFRPAASARRTGGQYPPLEDSAHHD
ncbi:Regulator of rDNA transcription protein 15 [Capsicum baccatum]|uniref:Regulator of rDNA transcription protein 15 n=1 Tax=Capsicum baccatum TaxID=33114 RepID=A0A2G2UXX8_CAPBA|nr:Regulator of rDNA transcription protein 15 [Capsicum baccatum]